MSHVSDTFEKIAQISNFVGNFMSSLLAKERETKKSLERAGLEKHVDLFGSVDVAAMSEKELGNFIGTAVQNQNNYFAAVAKKYGITIQMAEQLDRAISHHQIDTNPTEEQINDYVSKMKGGLI